MIHSDAIRVTSRVAFVDGTSRLFVFDLGTGVARIALDVLVFFSSLASKRAKFICHAL